MPFTLPTDENWNAVQAVFLPPAGNTITINTSTPAGQTTALPQPGLYRVFADGSGCMLNGMPLAVGVYEYFYIGDPNIVVTVGANANVYFTLVG